MEREMDTMTEDQERLLYAKLAYKYGRPGGPADALSADEQLIWDTICDLLGRRQLPDVLVKAGKDHSRQSYADDVAEVMAWLRHGCGNRAMSRTQWRAIVTESIECLGRYAQRGGAPFNHKTMLQQLASLPTAVERAYPGYAAAGLLDRVAAIAVVA